MGWQTFSIKGQLAYTLGFAGHMVSVATNELCSCSVKTAIDNIETSG